MKTDYSELAARLEMACAEGFEAMKKEKVQPAEMDTGQYTVLQQRLNSIFEMFIRKHRVIPGSGEEKGLYAILMLFRRKCEQNMERFSQRRHTKLD